MTPPPSTLKTWGITEDELTAIMEEKPSLRGMMFGYIGEHKLAEWLTHDPRLEACRKEDDHDRTKKGDLVVTYRRMEFRVEVKSLQTNRVEVLMPDGEWMRLMARQEVGRKPSPGLNRAGLPRKGAAIHRWRPDPRYLALSETFKKATRYRGVFQCDASDRRKVKLANGEEVVTTLLKEGEFDILAVCLFGFHGEWEYGFALNKDLPRSTHGNYTEEARQQLIASLISVTRPLEAPFVSDPFVLMDQLLLNRTETDKT